MFNVTKNIMDSGQMSMIALDTCKEVCRANCIEVVRQGSFNNGLWMLFSALVILLIYFVFNYNVTKNEKTRSILENKGYDLKKLEDNIHWIFLTGVAFIMGYIISFYFISGAILPMG